MISLNFCLWKPSLKKNFIRHKPFKYTKIEPLSYIFWNHNVQDPKVRPDGGEAAGDAQDQHRGQGRQTSGHACRLKEVSRVCLYIYLSNSFSPSIYLSIYRAPQKEFCGFYLSLSLSIYLYKSIDARMFPRGNFPEDFSQREVSKYEVSQKVSFPEGSFPEGQFKFPKR